MNRVEFGQLLAALRQDLNWTQAQFSEAADVDEPVISQIERGVKKHFDPDLLFRLANALQLTTLEQREFLLAASGLEERQSVRQASTSVKTDTFNSRRILDRMLELTALSPEEKLLRAIFGEKAGDVRDSSLRVPPGVSGTVINAKVFSRKGVDKDERAKAIEDTEEAKLLKDQNDEIRIIQDSAFLKIRKLLSGKEVAARLVDDKGEQLLRKGDSLSDELLDNVPQRYWGEIAVAGTQDVQEKVRKIIENFEEQRELVKLLFGEKIGRLKKGDELPPGVIKMVKVYVAIKRKVQPGDNMCGRHVNKGVISKSKRTIDGCETSSASAAAVRLPASTIRTKAAIALSLSIGRLSIAARYAGMN